MLKVIVSTTLAIVLTAIWAVALDSSTNEQLKTCLAASGYSKDNFDSFDFSVAAGCFQKKLAKKQAEELAELRDFLKHNPRYTVPGQSLNRCWGKPREMPFESAYIRADKNGYEAGVNYKDTLPAGCYENAPWDNRDAKNGDTQ